MGKERAKVVADDVAEAVEVNSLEDVLVHLGSHLCSEQCPPLSVASLSSSVSVRGGKIGRTSARVTARIENV